MVGHLAGMISARSRHQAEREAPRAGASPVIPVLVEVNALLLLPMPILREQRAKLCRWMPPRSERRLLLLEHVLEFGEVELDLGALEVPSHLHVGWM